MPEFDVHRRTTKVNIATGIGVILFLIIATLAIVWFVQRGHG